MSDKSGAGDPAIDELLELRVLEQVRELRKAAPETTDRILRMVEERLHHRSELESSQHRHRRRLEWAWFGFRVFMSSLGFGSLVVYALVATHFIDTHAPVQASVALGAGAVSVVAIFVTGRAAGPLLARQNRPKDDA